MKDESNQVLLTGRRASEFMFSHSYESENFYTFIMEVERTSGTKDNLSVMVSEYLIDKEATYDNICVIGQLRSFNQHDNTNRKLLLYVFAFDIFATEELDRNEVYMEGFICKQPTYRTTPQGREICDVMLAVNRSYGKSDYIPCIFWGRNARHVSKFCVGSKIRLQGRFQSREYEKNEETKTAYELSITKFEGM